MGAPYFVIVGNRDTGQRETSVADLEVQAWRSRDVRHPKFHVDRTHKLRAIVPVRNIDGRPAACLKQSGDGLRVGNVCGRTGNTRYR